MKNYKEKYYVQDTINHRLLVQNEINKVIFELQERLINHDTDKILNDVIYDCYAPIVAELRTVEYDTPKYHELIDKMDIGWEEHMKNRHHWVEEKYNKEKLEELTIMDLAEIVCDWIGAMKRNISDDEQIMSGVKHNIKRYGLENWGSLIIQTASCLLYR